MVSLLFLYPKWSSVQFSSVQSLSRVRHFETESQHTRPPCPSPSPRVHSNSRPLSRWCHPAISSSVVPFPPAPNPSQHQSLFQESTLCMRWPKYWSFSFSIIPSKEHPGLISEYFKKKKKRAWKELLFVSNLRLCRNKISLLCIWMFCSLYFINSLNFTAI